MHPSGQETFRVGFVLFVALLILVMGVILIGSETVNTGGRVQYKALFDDVGGLSKGAPVYLGGVPVGSVENVDFAEDPNDTSVAVLLSVDETKQGRVYRDSEVRIETEGLLGEKLVAINAGSAASGVMPVGGTLPSQRLPFLSGMVAKGERVVGEVSDLLAVLQSVLESIDKGEGSLGRFIQDPAVHDQLGRTLDEVGSLAEEYKSLGLELRTSAQNLESVIQEYTTRLGERGDELLSGIQSTVESVGGRMDSAVAEFQALTRDLREGDGSLPLLLRDDSLYREVETSVSNVSKAANRLAQILEEVADGDGTLSALLKDRTIITSLEDIVNGLRESSLVLNVIRNAERSGRRQRLEKSLGESEQSP